MSVPAHDELLLQSLEQSLCPNEEESTDSTSTSNPLPPHWALGSTYSSVAPQRELMIVLLVRPNGR